MRASEQTVDVWTAELAAIDAARLDEYRAWLTPEERDACARFATPRLSGEWLLTRALSRWVLSRYAPDVAPETWRFERNEAGRPYVVEPVDRIEGLPSFNLANADGFVVCAASAVPVGVDVEPLSRGEDISKTATKIFSASELAELSALDPAEQARRAVELWTLKEAYLKARGHGIAVRLERISLGFVSGAWKLRDVSVLGDEPDAWQLGTVEEDARMIAVAVARGSRPDLSLVLRPTVPTRDTLRVQ